MSKRQLVLDALNNRETERIPVGFWFHFVEGDDFFKGLDNPEIIQRNIEGHKKFYKAFQPDFVKLMSDGFFTYPSDLLKNVKSATELKNLKPIGENHPWITQQVELVKELTDSFGSEVLTFYNVFAPATFFKFLHDDIGNTLLANLIIEDKEAVKHALNVIGEDLAVLAKRVITEGKADGIYLSVQNVQDIRITDALYKEVVAPSELKVLAAANKASENNILHICGYEGSRNNLNLYTEYEAKVINWAVNIEEVSLSAGKKLFGNRAVIGGFANSLDSLIHKGSQEEVEAFTRKLIEEAGRTGVIIGADCTVSNHIELERLQWVRNSAKTL